MNQRLKELMLEAGYAAPELAGRAHKLAELIVKECANRATWAQDTNEKDIGREILKHFGVKE